MSFFSGCERDLLFVHMCTSVIGTVELLCTGIKYLLFSLTAARQTARIRVRLFQTILERVCYAHSCFKNY
jgi:hypothetical protein